ncbi:UNVERIFIED_CONTAM: hypothetical protein RMT77_014579 [Armadillidium vulgare]
MHFNELIFGVALIFLYYVDKNWTIIHETQISFYFCMRTCYKNLEKHTNHPLYPHLARRHYCYDVCFPEVYG